MPHTKLHDAIADAVALAETAVERTIPGRAEGIVLLLRDPTERDEEIWRNAFDAAAYGGAPVTEDDWDEDFGELADVPREARDFSWQAVWQVAIGAAQAQWDAEHVLRPLWAALQEGGLAVMAEAASVPRPLSKEAKRGPGRVRFDAARTKRRGA